MNRRKFIRTAAAGAAAMAFPAMLRSAGKRGDRPNVLFFSVDDMNTDGVFCGGTGAQTPHLSRLAAEGVSFARNYCQYPLCNPSRSSLMTGLRPDRTRIVDDNNDGHFRQTVPDVVTIPQLFKNNGYFSARVGKVFHAGNPADMGRDGPDDLPSWNHRVNPAGRDKDVLMQEAINLTPTHKGLGTAIAYYEDATGRDEEFTDGLVATEAIRLLEGHKDESFFLGVGFYKPHCPYIGPKKYFDLYPLDKVEAPVVPPGYRRSVPAAALESTLPWPDLGVTPEQSQVGRRAYYAVTSFVDAQVGRVMSALERLGLRERTIVVFWSDHGYHTGDHGLWFKRSCFEKGARVPLIIAPPRAASARGVCRRIVEHVDLYPTLADLAGLEPTQELSGVSLRPLLENPGAAWDRPAFTQVQREGFSGRSIRTAEWRYTEWDGGRRGVQLYRHEDDPEEMTNLASDTAYARVLAELKSRVMPPV